MQNIAIIGIFAVLLIGAAFYFTNTSDEGDVTTDPIVAETTDMSDDMDMEAEAVVASDIVTTAVNTPVLSTLVAAVTEAELVTTLQGEGPFTVFAPTNDAFAALPAGTLDTLLMEENMSDLQGILTYHVVPGVVMAGDLTDGMVVETVNGQTITINVSDAGVTINGSAAVTMADIVTSNGVVHVIDSVLLPASE